MSPRLTRFVFALIAVIAFAATGLRADTLAYGGRHKATASSASYEAVHVHDWDGQKTGALFFRPDALDAVFTSANDISSLVVRKRGSRKVILATPAPALTHLWISPDETLLVGLSKVMLRNPVQLAVWRLPSGQLIWRERIAAQQAEFSAEEMTDHLRAHPDNVATLAPITRQRGRSYFVDFLRSGMPERLGETGWAEFVHRLSPHPYSSNFSSSVTNHVYWYREPDPALRLDPGSEPGTMQLSLLDPQGIRFRIVLPGESASTPQPSPLTPYPSQDIRLTDPRELRPDNFGLRSIAERNTSPFVILSPDVMDVGATGNLHQTLRRLGITKPWLLFSPGDAELAAARSHTRHLYFIVPELREKSPADGAGEFAQAIGVAIAGRRCVLVNVLPAIASRSETEFLLREDGGPRVFQLLYDIDAGAITHWHFNGGL